MPLKRVTDGPLFGSPVGTLSSLTNMRLLSDGYAEARGGFDKMKNSIGTATAAIAAGGFSDAIQLSTSYGWVRDFDSAAAAGSQYSANRQLSEGGWTCFGMGSTVATNAMYWGADQPFSRIMLSLSQALNSATFVVVYEYWNGGSWAALTTAETIDFTVLRTPQFASWAVPSGWLSTTVGDAGTGNVRKFWMRIRISSITGLVTSPLGGLAIGFWGGMREIYAATQDWLTGASTGTLKRQGENSVTQEWFSLSTSLFSGYASPARLIEYRGRLILVNGKDTKRFDGANFKDLGIQSGGSTLTLTAAAGGVLGAGVWRYYYAWGEGPCQNTSAYADRQDALSLYGPGQATYIGEVTTIAAQRVAIQLTVGRIPTGASALYLYRTDDLTNVDAGDKPNHPAFLIQSFRVQIGPALAGRDVESLLLGISTYYDDNKAKAFPQQEALTYDVSPVSRCNYALIYQNRLMLGDTETWYISDPFTPDKFSTKSTTGYIRLARATGGRHMGGLEFADQAVLYTEDQTWGLTNVDLDVPQLYPIHPGVGCVAPDAAAAGDGRLIWPSRNGFYMWDGGRKEPVKISSDMDQTFQYLSYETIGGSKAVLINRVYKIRLAAPDGTPGLCWEYSLDSGQWNKSSPTGFASTLFPLAAVHAPIENIVPGTLHGLWGKGHYDAGGTDYFLYLDDLTALDNTTPFTCSATMHFQLPANSTLTPSQVLCYYQAADGWGTPTLANAVANPVGSSAGTLTADTPNTGSDYSLLQGTYSSVGATSDIQATFSVASTNGTAMIQRFFGGVLKGKPGPMRRRLA